VIFIVIVIFRNAVHHTLVILIHGWHIVGFLNIRNFVTVGSLCFGMRFEHSELCICWKLVLWHEKAFVSALNTRKKNQQF